MRRISIFGATGSVGQNTIDLIARAPDSYRVVALTGGRNVVQLAEDARRLNAEVAVTAYDSSFAALKDALAGTGIEVAAGTEAILAAAERPVDWAMSAIVGAAGLAPGLAVLRQGATLALANKETLVAAGPLVMRTAAEHGATILPVDSEHSAAFQCLMGEDPATVERLILTASGGAFRDWPLENLAGATPEQAATHPNWDMGQRITIDSASMFNKALEVIEAKEFFGVEPDRIEVLLHPESLVHAMVGHHDGAILAHLGPPDMRHAIGYALHWPKRQTLPVHRLNLAEIGRLSFYAPDPARYPALDLARQVMTRGGLSGAILNAAKERALDAFIDHRLSFTGMAGVVARVLDRAEGEAGLIDAEFSLDNVQKADQMARRWATEIIERAAFT